MTIYIDPPPDGTPVKKSDSFKLAIAEKKEVEDEIRRLIHNFEIFYPLEVDEIKLIREKYQTKVTVSIKLK